MVGHMVIPHLPERLSMDSTEAHKALDSAISTFSDIDGDAGALVTGWVLSVSVVHPSLPGSDGYFSSHSPGLPYHSQLGLHHSALEEMKTTVMTNHLKGRDA